MRHEIVQEVSKVLWLITARRLAARALATLILLVLLLVAGMMLAPDAAAQGGSGPAPTGTIVFQATSGGPIYAVDPDGANLRYLSTGMDPTLSPDGQWVAFTRWDYSQHGALSSLWVINVDGGFHLRRL